MRGLEGRATDGWLGAECLLDLAPLLGGKAFGPLPVSLLKGRYPP